MKGRDTCRLLQDIIAEIVQITRMTGNYRYDDFYRDEQVRAAVAGHIRTVAEYERGIPTIVRVKYMLVPWKELGSMEETIARAAPADRPRLLWKIGTETLPQIRLLLEDILKDMEK